MAAYTRTIHQFPRPAHRLEGWRGPPLFLSGLVPHLAQILPTETDPTFRLTLQRQLQSQAGDRTVDVVRRSGGLAQGKQLVRMQIQDYQRQLASQANATDLGHSAMRDRLTRAMDYNSAESELLEACRN